MPPLRPVAAVASRASASSASWLTSLARPAVSTMPAKARITSCLSAPEGDVEAYQVFGDHLGHGLKVPPM